MIRNSPDNPVLPDFGGCKFLAALLVFIVGTFLGVSGGLAAGSEITDFIPIKDISRGMTGYGLTVFEGSRIDTFQVTVVGIQEKVRASGSLILVEVAGHGLEKSSIAQGMSGSPVFLEGRFAGALAFGWGGALRPLAGVTPAREILNLPTDLSHTRVEPFQGSQPGWNNPNQALDQLWRSDQAAGLVGAILGQVQPPNESPPGLQKLSGWPSAEQLALDLLAEESQPAENWFISPLGFAGNGLAGSVGGKPAELLPGSACAVPLITGDAQLGAIGTVTWVDGDDVFMMGHPFMQRGPVDFPLATAEILTVFPSRQISFKLGSVGHIVGTVHHDQRAGLAGRLGPAPELIPVAVDLEFPGLAGQDQSHHRYNFQVVDDRQLTPTLVFWALYNSLLVEGDDASRQNLAYRIELDFERLDGVQLKPLVLAGLTAGPGGVRRLASDWMAPIAILLNNPFAELKLAAVRASLEISRPTATATITGVTAPRLLATPGQEISCRVDLVPWQGIEQQVEVSLRLPADLEPGNYRLAVANASEMFALEAQRAPGAFLVTSLDGLLGILRTERATSTLVVSLLAPGRSMVLKGRQMKGLPGRVSRVIRSGNMDITPTMADFVTRQDIPTEWVLQGHAIRNIEVAPRAKSAKQERRP